MTADESERTLVMVRTLMDRAHLATTGQLPDAVLAAARTLGWTAVVYLVDHEQRLLLPAPAEGVPERRPQAIATTVAGRCFRSMRSVVSPTGASRVWLPMFDGADRLGVLEVLVPEGADLDDPLFEERGRLLSHLTGHLIAAKSPYGDALDGIRRQRPRTVASELLHEILPPLSFACEGLVVSCLLQPAYDVAADAFDYSVVDDTAHLAILDATGHDLDGTILAALAIAAYRNSRRNGHGLHDCIRAVDELIADHGGGERFATGVLAELELSTGRLRYLNAGHPAPLLVRDGKVVKELEGGHRILLGLGDGQVAQAEEWLQPGDWIVLYTDGITEARDGDGEFFGVERLVEHLEKAAAAGLNAPETLRRISHDVLDSQGGVLQDDATLLIAEWASTEERAFITSTRNDVAPQDFSPTPHGVPRR
ncbi:GAF domain-containing SpoIIE family protein phosphatase [Kineococcus glutinatus]|uniref:PP2C family protein-serine/threonine phosphatase n=1 Tax=Kineococcus glutinatus TaxID=1070872 RepID=A0ABP9HEW2_9ACTN